VKRNTRQPEVIAENWFFTSLSLLTVWFLIFLYYKRGCGGTWEPRRAAGPLFWLDELTGVIEDDYL